MKPKPDPLKDQFQLFQANFGQLLNPQHPLVLLADKIDWPRFDEELLPCYAESCINRFFQGRLIMQAQLV